MAVYKTVTYTIANNDAGRKKIRDARRQINKQQQDTVLEIFNLLLTWGGLFHPVVGITSAAFSGVTTTYYNFLEKWEDIYTQIEEDMWVYRPEVSTNISYVKISYDLIGNAERYRAGLPRFTYHKN